MSFQTWKMRFRIQKTIFHAQGVALRTLRVSIQMWSMTFQTGREAFVI